jgi:hypothetical protein
MRERPPHLVDFSLSVSPRFVALVRVRLRLRRRTSRIVCNECLWRGPLLILGGGFDLKSCLAE